MKLINFKHFDLFKKIRKSMGISDNFKPDFEGSKAIAKELKLKEIKTKGLDISIDELFVAPDKTLEHKDFPGQKMIVYIRDFIGDYQKDYISRESYPRFHLSWCKTLKQMHESGKYDRYVVSQRNDGIFLLNKTITGRVVEKDIELELLVCKNCLETLRYQGYSRSSSFQNNMRIFNNFKVKEFFEKYNTDITITPTHTSASQPLNVYPSNWNEISYRQKEMKNFKCQNCGKDCSRDHSELHCHHIDGVKSNNAPSNLEVVCIKCHSNKPHHAHMKMNPKFKKYIF